HYFEQSRLSMAGWYRCFYRTDGKLQSWTHRTDRCERCRKIDAAQYYCRKSATDIRTGRAKCSSVATETNAESGTARRCGQPARYPGTMGCVAGDSRWCRNRERL